MKYCLDANFFITTWRYYSPGIAKDYRNWLTKLAVDKEIFIPTEVYEEIEVGGDGLYDWLKNIKNKIVVPMDGKTQEILVQIMRDKPEARNIADSNKKDNADIFVVASAKRNNSTVVTNDTKLRNLCKTCDVKCLKDYEFLKEKKLKMSISK
jgi:predicted nucleic acid-binding protein